MKTEGGLIARSRDQQKGGDTRGNWAMKMTKVHSTHV
jgi:hypothetical protein